MKRIVPIIIILVALLIVASGLLKPSMGNVVETWQVENQNLRLRVLMRQERCFAVCGAYYTFLSAPVGSDNWREIFTVHHDDPNPIPREQVRFVSEQVGYVFFGSKYAVTTNGGLIWYVWDAWEAEKNMPFKNRKLHPSIVEVNIEPTGGGRMRLYTVADKPLNQLELQTVDFGRSWQLN